MATVEVGRRIASVGEGRETRIGGKDACGPLPDFAQEPAFGVLHLGALPFGLARQPRADKAAIGLGLIGADAVDGQCCVAARPVKRTLDPARGAPSPALLRPERRLLIAARRHEAAVLPLAHRPAREAKGGKLDRAGRPLVVERLRPVIALASKPRRHCDERLILRPRKAAGRWPVDAGEPAHDRDGLGVLGLVLEHEAPDRKLVVGQSALQSRERAGAHGGEILREPRSGRQVAPRPFGHAVLPEEELPFRMGIGSRREPKRLRIGDVADMPADRAERRIGLGTQGIVAERAGARQGRGAAGRHGGAQLKPRFTRQTGRLSDGRHTLPALAE